MRAPRGYWRRQFPRAGSAGLAASGLTTSGPVAAGAQALVQAPPPAATAPRMLRKPPLTERRRIATLSLYGLELTDEELASCRRRTPAARSTWGACPFDVTGHPAVSVPAGMSQGLPVGMMLVGRHREDGTVLRAADAFQKPG